MTVKEIKGCAANYGIVSVISYVYLFLIYYSFLINVLFSF